VDIGSPEAGRQDAVQRPNARQPWNERHSFGRRFCRSEKLVEPTKKAKQSPTEGEQEFDGRAKVNEDQANNLADIWRH
jgi:hypothetical protein